MSKFFKTLTLAAVASGLIVSTNTGASAASVGALTGLKAAAPQSQIINVGGRRHHHRHHHHGGRNAGLAILGAAAATAIIAGSARSDRGYYRGGNRCEYYDYKCSRGFGWACSRYERYCD